MIITPETAPLIGRLNFAQILGLFDPYKDLFLHDRDKPEFMWKFRGWKPKRILADFFGNNTSYKERIKAHLRKYKDPNHLLQEFDYNARQAIALYFCMMIDSYLAASVGTKYKLDRLLRLHHTDTCSLNEVLIHLVGSEFTIPEYAIIDYTDEELSLLDDKEIDDLAEYVNLQNGIFD